MDITRLKQARQLFANSWTGAATQRYNMRQWVKSLRRLGNRWLLHTPMRFKT